MAYTQGRYAEALQDHLAAAAIDPNDASTQNFIAWLQATGPKELRNGEAAVWHATRACETTNHEVIEFVDTLAAACAEAKRFDEAVKWQIRVIESVPPDDRDEARRRLRLYESRSAYRKDVPHVEPDPERNVDGGNDGEIPF